MLILNKNKTVENNWNKLRLKIYSIKDIHKSSKYAYLIHGEGHRIHSIAHNFKMMNEDKISEKIHHVARYYHSIGEDLLQNIFNLFQIIPKYYFHHIS